MKFIITFFVLLLCCNVAIADDNSLYKYLKDSYWVSSESDKYYTFDKNNITAFELSDQKLVLKSPYKVLSKNSFKIIDEDISSNHCRISDDLLSIKITLDKELFILRKAPALTQKSMEGLWESLPSDKASKDSSKVQIEYSKNRQKIKRVSVNLSKKTHTINSYDDEYTLKKGFIFENDGYQYYAIEKKGDKILYSDGSINGNTKWYEVKLSKSLQFNIPKNSTLVEESE